MAAVQSKEIQKFKGIIRRTKNVRKFLLMLINKLIIKEKNGVFVSPLDNCIKDKYDLINFSADNALSLLNYWLINPSKENYKIYLVVHHPDRIKLYEEYVSNCKHLSFCFVLSPLCFKGKKVILGYSRYLLSKFKCKYWLYEGVSDVRGYAVKGQKQFDVSYFASCKSNYIFDKVLAADIRKFSTPERVTVFSASFFDSLMKSAAFGMPIQCFLPYGMARDDNFRNSVCPKKAKIWIESKKRTKSTRVILYAPTFRDYENVENVKERSIWGAGYDDAAIKDFLDKKNAIVIAKLHSWQNENIILTNNESIVSYEPNFDFSFYDLMKLADILITDYSSIGYDWFFVDKPLIYNLWDYEVYKKKRGLAYEPYERVCGGQIVKNTNELIQAIDMALKYDLCSEKRRKIRNLMFTIQDYSSCEKIINYIISE